MIVIARKVGRLANRIVLFAHFIAAGAEHGFAVLNPSFHPYAGYFPSTAHDLFCRFPRRTRVAPLPGARRLLYRATLLTAGSLHRLQAAGREVGLIRLRRDQHLDLNSEVFLDAVRRHRVVFVQDWFFRNGENCRRHRELLRAHFTPLAGHLARARAVVEPARRRGRFLVGVHIRRGDYWRFKGGAFYFSYQQYRDVLKKVEAAFPDEDVSFLVCSDEVVPREAVAGLDVLHGSGHELEDLYALAECDRIVGPPSTYSTWASFYGGAPLYRLSDPGEVPSAASFLLDQGFE